MNPQDERAWVLYSQGRYDEAEREAGLALAADPNSPQALVTMALCLLQRGQFDVGQALWRMPYPEVNQFFDELLPPGLRHYWKANASSGFSDDAIAVHLEHGLKVPTPESGLFVFPINGACHRVSDEETAFANRHTEFSAVIAGTWSDRADDEEHTQWVRGYFEALKPFTEAGGYVNFMAEDDQELADVSYGKKYRRLQEIKTRYDPGNLFRVNQNIPPD